MRILKQLLASAVVAAFVAAPAFAQFSPIYSAKNSGVKNNFCIGGTLSVGTQAAQAAGTEAYTTISVPVPAAARALTIPDNGGNSSFILTQGSPTGGITKAKDYNVNIGTATAALANSTVFSYLIAPGRAGTLTLVGIAAAVKPAGGTNTVQVLKNGTTTMLSAATFDPTTITANFTEQNIPLTATPANLTLLATDTIEVIYTSGVQGTAAQAPTISLEMSATDY